VVADLAGPRAGGFEERKEHFLTRCHRYATIARDPRYRMQLDQADSLVF
jgi:hypothetical protein